MAVAVSQGCLHQSPSVPSPALGRVTITLPAGDQFSNAGRHLVALSPDGTQLVYVANQRLYLRALQQSEAVPLRGTEGTGTAAGRSPFFSPDGQWIGFWQDGQLKKISITGGSPVVLCAAQNPWGASWAGDNTIFMLRVRLGSGVCRATVESRRTSSRLTPVRSRMGRNRCPVGARSCSPRRVRTMAGTLRKSSSGRSTPAYVASSWKAGPTRAMR